VIEEASVAKDKTGTEETERTDDAAFTDEAARKLGDATERETNEQAGEEDGSSPDEPQPTTYPDPETEEPGQPEPNVTTSDDPPA